MEKILLFLTISFCSIESYAQSLQTKQSAKPIQNQHDVYNAYTVAKEITQFCNLKETEFVTREQAEALLSYLISYSNFDTYETGFEQTMAKYPTLYGKYQTIKQSYASLDKDFQQTLSRLNHQEFMSKHKATLTAEDNNCLMKMQASREKIKKHIDRFMPHYEATLRLQMQMEAGKFEVVSKDKAKELLKVQLKENANFAFSIDSIFGQASELSFEEIRRYADYYKQTIALDPSDDRKAEIEEYLKLSPNALALLKNHKVMAFYNVGPPMAVPHRLNNAISQIPSVLVNAPQTEANSISLYSMDQSQMIDAAAMMLVKRVKQEALIWFFDEMRRNSELYELLSVSLPETMKLLQSEEVYTAPNLGSSWRYALGKDFTTMPEHIFTSDWLKRRIPDEHQAVLDYLPVGWDIARYIEEKFSYRDIIRQLYLTKKDPVCKSSITPNTIIDALYAITNELYVKDYTVKDTLGNYGVRLLTYEELRGMTAEEMEIMMILLNLKYDDCIRAIQGTRAFDHPFTRDDVNKLAMWTGRVTSSLRQFDLILRDLAESSKNENRDFNYYNVWILMTEVIDQLLPPDDESEEYKQVRYSLARLSDSYEIYDLLSKRNYAGAVGKTLELIDLLLYSDSIEWRFSQINSISFEQSEISYILPLKSFIKGDTGIDTPVPMLTLDAFLKTRRTKEDIVLGAVEGFKIPIPVGVLARKLEKLGYKQKKINRIIDCYVNPSVLIPIQVNNIRLQYRGSKWKIILDSKDIYENLNAVSFLKRNGAARKLTRAMDAINDNWDISTGQGELKKLIQENGPLWQATVVKTLDSVVARFPTNSPAAAMFASWDRKSIQMMRKLSSFLNDVAAAKSTEQLSEVVSSYALPPGSYKQKRSAWRCLNINAYVGPYAAYEGTLYRSQYDGKFVDSQGWVFGLSAPIGISWTTPFSKTLKGNSKITTLERNNPDLLKIKKDHIKSLSKWSFTTTFSIIDLGAVVSYRFTHTDNVLPQQFKWEQFVSPGVHFGLSIPNTPLIISLGAQVTPQVRRLKPETGMAEGPQLNMLRFYGGIYFDIPLFNLYTRTRFVKH